MLALALRQAVRNQPHRAVRDRLHDPALGRRGVRDDHAGPQGPLFIATRHADPPRRHRHAGLPRRARRPGPAGLRRGGCAGRRDAGVDRATSTTRCARSPTTSPRRLRQPSGRCDRRRHGCRSEAIIQAAANVAWALDAAGRPAQLAFTLPECNSLGLALHGRAAAWTKLLPARPQKRQRRHGHRPGKRPLPARRRQSRSTAFWARRARDRARSPAECHDREAADVVLPAAHLRRGRRHAGQQRRPGAALLPGRSRRQARSRRAGAGCAR